MLSAKYVVCQDSVVTLIPIPMLDIFYAVIMIKHMKALLTFFYLSAAALVFGAESNVLYRQTVNIKALSNGAEKTIYSTIGKEKVENQITLIVTALPSGDIQIRSEKFKLGKMPFSSSFQFIIPQEEIIQNTDGAYVINNLAGIYKVAASKPQALLTGTLGSHTCELSLAVEGMGKKLAMQLFSVKNQELNEKEETSLNNGEKASSSSAE